MNPIIRQAQTADLPYLYEICRLTGMSGDDATPAMADPFLLGQVFAAPYVVHDPRFCLVACKQGRPIGYLVGTQDTTAYNTWFAEAWLPQLLGLYDDQFEAASDFDLWAKSLVRVPDPLEPFLVDYPAHLHIDLLPAAQGQGLGRSLIEAFCQSLFDSGVKGLHLCVGKSNPSAIAFYQKVGFVSLAENPGSIHMGRSLQLGT